MLKYKKLLLFIPCLNLFTCMNAYASFKQMVLTKHGGNLGQTISQNAAHLVSQGHSLNQALATAQSHERLEVIMTAAHVAADTKKNSAQKIADLMELAKNPPGFIPHGLRQASSFTSSPSLNILSSIKDFEATLASQLEELIVDKKVIETLKTELEEQQKCKSSSTSNQTSPPPAPSQPSVQVTAANTASVPEEIETLKQQIADLNAAISKFTGAPVESMDGKPVWLSLRSPSFIHNRNLKKSVQIDNSNIQQAAQDLKKFYSSRISGYLTPMQRIMMLTIKEIKEDDPDSISHALRDEAKIKACLPKIKILCEVTNKENPEAKKRLQQDFDQLWNATQVAYTAFSQEKSTKTIKGLEDYIKVQNDYAALAAEIEEQEYLEFMKTFTEHKGKFKTYLQTQVSSQPSCHKLLDILELGHGYTTFSTFVTAFGIEPSDKTVKGYNDLPYVLMWQFTGTGQSFTELGILNRKKYNAATKNHEISEAGLEMTYPFSLIKTSDEFHFSSDQIDTVEKAYMMKFLQKRWEELTPRFSAALISRVQSLNQKRVDAPDKPLLTESGKQQLKAIFDEKDILDKPLYTQLGIIKVLEDHIKPALLSQNYSAWESTKQLDVRETLMELYQTYSGLMKYAKELHAKNPKIKEFHED